MDNLQLNVVSCYAASRKDKENLIPNEVFDGLLERNNNCSKTTTRFLNRGISSAIVARQEPYQSLNTTEIASFHEPSNSQNLPLLRKNTWDDRLRTPNKRNPKQKMNILQIEKGMTRNCASLFSQMHLVHKPVRKPPVDPRYSVRKVLKRSGLLKIFGRGLINENDDIESDDPQAEFNEISEENATMNVDLFSDTGPTEFDQSASASECSPTTIKSDDFITNLVPNSQLETSEFSFITPVTNQFLQTTFSVPNDCDSVSMRSGQEASFNNSTDLNNSSSPTVNSGTSFTALSQISHISESSHSTELSSPETQKVNNMQYETIIMQKTVEMELMQIVPMQNKRWNDFFAPNNKLDFKQMHINPDNPEEESNNDRQSISPIWSKIGFV